MNSESLGMRICHSIAAHAAVGGIALAGMVLSAWCATEGNMATRTSALRITVRNEVLNPVNDELFGQFMERAYGGELGAEAGVDQATGKLQPEVRKLLSGMRIPLVRFPGGTAVDYREWTEMVDNIPGRGGPRPTTRVKDSRTNEEREYNNRFGYDEFLRLAETNGWATDLVVNFRDGLLGVKPLEEAVAHQAKLLAYCNAPVDAALPKELAEFARLRAANGHEKPYGVKYVQIGNETWFFEESVKQTHPDDPTGHWIKCLRRYVQMIRSIDPNARIIVDAYPQPVAEAMHREFGKAIFAYAWHLYRPWGIKEIRKDGHVVDLSTLSARDVWNAWVTVPLVDADGQSVLEDKCFEPASRLGYKVAMTEWNWNGGWWGRKGPVPLDSLLAKGVGAASFLHSIMRRGALIPLAAQSMLVGNAWDIAAIHADPDAREAPYMRPMGMVTMLYSQHHGSQRLAATLENMPFFEQPYDINMLAPKKVAAVDVVCTRSAKAVFVHMVNRQFESPMPVEVDVASLGAGGAAATLHVMTGRLENEPPPGESRCPTRIDARTVPVSAAKATVELPSRSVAILEIPLIARDPKNE